MARDCPNYQTASFPSGRPRTALCGAGVSLRADHFAGVGKMVGLSAGFRHAALIGRLPRYPDTQIPRLPPGTGGRAGESTNPLGPPPEGMGHPTDFRNHRPASSPYPIRRGSANSQRGDATRGWQDAGQGGRRAPRTTCGATQRRSDEGDCRVEISDLKTWGATTLTPMNRQRALGNRH